MQIGVFQCHHRRGSIYANKGSLPTPPNNSAMLDRVILSHELQVVGKVGSMTGSPHFAAIPTICHGSKRGNPEKIQGLPPRPDVSSPSFSGICSILSAQVFAQRKVLTTQSESDYHLRVMFMLNGQRRLFIILLAQKGL